jgi:hypothetical protein
MTARSSIASRLGGVMLTVACVSTDLGDPPLAPLCVATLSAEVATDAVVAIDADLVEGRLLCSGVAVSKTLVVTSIGCAFRPSDIGDPDELTDPDDIEYFPDLLYASVPYELVCDRERDWAPLENGSFSASFGKPLELSELHVYKASALEQRVDVKRIVTSSASSRCAPGLALLVLERELDVTPLPIRLLETSFPDEPVLLSGNCVDGDHLSRRDLDSGIEAITFDQAEAAAPPHSLLVSQGVLAPTIGGAVVSPASGALIGIVASGTDYRCNKQDPAASTLAVRVASFRSLLLDVAGDEGITLLSEPSPGTPAHACPREP